MTKLDKGPQGLRRGRGARERIVSAAQQLFRDQGINSTGIDQLCAVAGVSKRTLYQHFTGKDELIAECLRRFDPDILPEVFDSTDLTPRERLLAAFDVHAPLCPFIAAAVEIPDPGHSARLYARDYKKAFAARRCCWTAPRPAAESSTPRPSPPPPPSRPSSSTKPSPRQRYRVAQARRGA
jgi:AcrR family transcriptional regulator